MPPECPICEGMCCGLASQAVTEAAVAYVTEPEGSDQIPQFWHELQEAVRQYLNTNERGASSE